MSSSFAGFCFLDYRREDGNQFVAFSRETVESRFHNYGDVF